MTMRVSTDEIDLAADSQRRQDEVSLPLSDNAYLRPLCEEDVTDAYVQGLNDPAVHRFLTDVRRTRQTRATVEDYVRANRENDSDLLFGLFIKDVLRGTVRLHDIETGSSAQAWLGVAIFDPSCWGQGWGSTAIEAVVRYGFDKIELTRINAGIYRKNEASRRTFARAGFKVAGTHDGDEVGPAEQWTIGRNPS